MTFEDPKDPLPSDPSFLSTKTIPPEDRLIFALDVPSVEEAKRLVLALRESVQFYKVGLELFATGGYFELIDWLVGQGKKVFADLKLFDVPETVRSAVRQLSKRPIALTTVHGNDGILEAACRDKGDLKILAVTVLTSLDQGDLTDLGFSVDVHRLVLSRARRALEIGCDGVVSSGLEARALRDHLGEKLLIVTPGIRPVENRPADDQKRVVTVEQALRNGADYIVVGRPIRNAPDPYQAALQIQGTIEGLFL
ncbi:MAG TPA: orotidine-5'-phosphate decarboxylase [Thermoanaerobaculia bacterium]|nr:orotidine-5'-phosphate decarboxylase [Thermoanaerobaculia bacterium]